MFFGSFAAQEPPLKFWLKIGSVRIWHFQGSVKMQISESVLSIVNVNRLKTRALLVTAWWEEDPPYHLLFIYFVFPVMCYHHMIIFSWKIDCFQPSWCFPLSKKPLVSLKLQEKVKVEEVYEITHRVFLDVDIDKQRIGMCPLYSWTSRHFQFIANYWSDFTYGINLSIAISFSDSFRYCR